VLLWRAVFGCQFNCYELSTWNVSQEVMMMSVRASKGSTGRKFELRNNDVTAYVFLTAGTQTVTLSNLSELQRVDLPCGVKVVLIDRCPKLKQLIIPQGAVRVSVTNMAELKDLVLPKGTRVVVSACPKLNR
jgi:hypothetical protein